MCGSVEGSFDHIVHQFSILGGSGPRPLPTQDLYSPRDRVRMSTPPDSVRDQEIGSETVMSTEGRESLEWGMRVVVPRTDLSTGSKGLTFRFLQ